MFDFNQNIECFFLAVASISLVCWRNDKTCVLHCLKPSKLVSSLLSKYLAGTIFAKIGLSKDMKENILAII